MIFAPTLKRYPGELIVGLFEPTHRHRTLQAMTTPPIPADQTRRVVLVVDDEPFVRGMMVDVLRESLSVLEAEDGEKALAAFENANGRIAAVVTDVRMPKVDGVTLALALGQQPEPPVILFVTGFASNLELPGPVLQKPFRPEQLVAAVHNLLGGISSA